MKRKAVVLMTALCVLFLVSAAAFSAGVHGGHTQENMQQTDIHSTMSMEEMNQHLQTDKNTQVKNAHEDMTMEEMMQHSDMNAHGENNNASDHDMQMTEGSHGSSHGGHSEGGSHSGKSEGADVDLAKRKLVVGSFFTVIAAVIIIAWLTRPKNNALKKGAI